MCSPSLRCNVNVNYGLSSLASSYIKRRDRHLRLLLAFTPRPHSLPFNSRRSPSSMLCNPIMDEWAPSRLRSLFIQQQLQDDSFPSYALKGSRRLLLLDINWIAPLTACNLYARYYCRTALTKQVGPDCSRSMYAPLIAGYITANKNGAGSWRKGWSTDRPTDRPTEYYSSKIQKGEIHKSITVYKNEMASASESWASLFVRQLFDIIMARERKKKRTKT